jgi:putative FmdB family regulatory protein
MPFYEYECAGCGGQHEVLQKISDRALRKCPDCGRNALRRLVSAPVFRLKGGGWYETDFKSDAERKRNLAVEKEPATAKTDEKKPEGKPAAEAGPAAGKAGEDRPAKTVVPVRKPAARAGGRRRGQAGRAAARRRR